MAGSVQRRDEPLLNCHPFDRSGIDRGAVSDFAVEGICFSLLPMRTAVPPLRKTKLILLRSDVAAERGMTVSGFRFLIRSGRIMSGVTRVYSFIE